MKTITIRLPDVEASMFRELQSRRKRYSALMELFVTLIRREYGKF